METKVENISVDSFGKNGTRTKQKINKRNLRQRVGKTNEMDKTSYQCTYCGKRFISQSKLKIHEMIHTGERPFKCEICGKCFNQLVNLNKHLKYHDTIHKGVKLFQCNTIHVRHLLVN